MAKPKSITRAQFQVGIKFYVGNNDNCIFKHEGVVIFKEMNPIIVDDQNRYHCSILEITDKGFTASASIVGKIFTHNILFKKCFIAENQ